MWTRCPCVITISPGIKRSEVCVDKDTLAMVYDSPVDNVGGSQ